MNSLTMRSLLRLVALHALLAKDGLPNNPAKWTQLLAGLQELDTKLYPGLRPGGSSEPR